MSSVSVSRRPRPPQLGQARAAGRVGMISKIDWGGQRRPSLTGHPVFEVGQTKPRRPHPGSTLCERAERSDAAARTRR